MVALPSLRSPLVQAIGPGILFAGAAIGVSHLVQSTRAGALYGLSLVWLIVLAHAMKLPAMLFGPRYAAATGRSLLDGYRRQGVLALAAFGVIQVGTMFTIQAAVTLVTAALVGPLVVDPLLVGLGVLTPGGHAPAWAVCAGILLACSAVLALGGFRWLDAVVKALMVVMALGTIAAACIALPGLEWSSVPVWPRRVDVALVLFAVALVGWMPAPLDITVWHSLWSLARDRQSGQRASKAQCQADFALGYGLCVVLAVAFAVLGAALLYGREAEPAAGAGAFANQLVGLYTQTLGAWSRPLIAACAIAVMLSTTITVLDAIPRTMSAFVAVARGLPETPPDRGVRLSYWAWLAALAAGAVLIVAVLARSLTAMVDLATTLSFLGTPILAWCNHRAMVSADVPEAHRPGRFLRMFSLLGVGFWALFALLYVGTWLL